MGSAWTIRQSAATDWPAIAGLLAAAQLPLNGAQEHLAHFACAWQGEALVGVAGLEMYGEVALLRSVAVAADQRGTGLGAALVRWALERARSGGVRSVALLTTTAGTWFPRFGFKQVERSELPAALEASAEFRGACPASAVAMCLNFEG